MVTNHSLRASGTTELYYSGAPENIIKEQTGHKSVDALRMYERTSIDQYEAVSKALQKPMIPRKQEPEVDSSPDILPPKHVNKAPLKEGNCGWSDQQSSVPCSVPLGEYTSHRPFSSSVRF